MKHSADSCLSVTHMHTTKFERRLLAQRVLAATSSHSLGSGSRSKAAMQAASRGLLLRNSSSTWLHKAENGRILFEGRNFSKYEITSTQRLGGGHFGTIFAVKEVRTGRECVVKLYKRSQREAALDVAHEKNFLIMARRCQCPYLIDYVDDLLDLRRGCYMVLSPVCRETMEQRLQRIRRGQERDYGFRTWVKASPSIGTFLKRFWHDLEALSI